MKNKVREYRSQKIPEMWFIDAIKEGHNTPQAMIKKLGISQKACYYKLRKMLYEGKIKRDTSRVPFVYYLREDEEQ